MTSILIVDDNKDNRTLLSFDLSDEGYDVLLAENGPQAIELVATGKPDLILLDVVMPGMSGLEVCQRLKKSPGSEKIPIIMVTSNDSDEDIAQGLDAGAQDYVAKPVNLTILLARIRSALRLQLSQNQLAIANTDLEKMSQKTQMLLDRAGEGIIEYDKQGLIQYINPKALHLLKYNKDELVNTSVFDLLYQSKDQSMDAEIIKKKMIKAAEKNQEFRLDQVFLHCKDDKQIVVEFSCNNISTKEDYHAGNVLMFQDITSRVKNEERLIKLAKFDVLTGAANRSQFHDFTNGVISYCQRHGKKFALFFLDIDHFKNINDTMGHDAGDELLIDVASRLKKCVRSSDLVARIGGDEFAITLLRIEGPNQLTSVARNIISIMASPFNIQGKQLNVSCSIGIAMFPDSGEDLNTLTKASDTAMYQAKSLGRNTFQFFSSEIQKQVEQRTCLEEDLHRAVKNKEFFLHYQPQVDLATGDLLGLEALIRWQHSNWLDIGPGQFIPVAEECGLLPAIGEWVLYTACQQAATWAGMIEDFNIPISINMSPRQLLSHDFIHTLKKVFLDTGVSAKNIVLELTESAVMKNPDVAIEVLRQIHDMGVEISVDDFGTGYSSLSYLRLFPIDRLKVDYSFVKDIGKDKYADAIVKTILALAHSLDLHVIAEGVETIEQVEFLLKNNCQHVQGFFFSKPIPAKEAELLLLQKQIDWESHTANLFQKKITPPDHDPHLH